MAAVDGGLVPVQVLVVQRETELYVIGARCMLAKMKRRGPPAVVRLQRQPGVSEALRQHLELSRTSLANVVVHGHAPPAPQRHEVLLGFRNPRADRQRPLVDLRDAAATWTIGRDQRRTEHVQQRELQPIALGPVGDLTNDFTAAIQVMHRLTVCGALTGASPGLDPALHRLSKTFRLGVVLR